MIFQEGLVHFAFYFRYSSLRIQPRSNGHECTTRKAVDYRARQSAGGGQKFPIHALLSVPLVKHIP